jgi:general secretion pathway protein G
MVMHRSSQHKGLTEVFSRAAVRPRPRLASQHGFTLLELIVVISIILILAAIGAGRYYQSVIRAREAVLHQDLQDMRKAIQDYTRDKECGPSSLSDLAGTYLNRVPEDPMTGAADWTTDNTDLLIDPDQTCSGITDVHSSSDKSSPFENTPYNSW